MTRAFVIALPNEAEVIRPHLKPGDRLYVCGIGKVNAAAATMRAICEGADEIWNFGFAGGFDPAMEIGDICVIESAVEYDFDLATLNGTRVGQLNERSSPYIPLAIAQSDSPGNLAVRQCVLASGDHFNDSDTDLALLKELGTMVRDMEGAAIAHVCEKEGVPCHSVKCISDVHGRGSMTGQYVSNIPLCQRKLGEAVKALIG